MTMTLSLEAHQATQTPSKWTLLQRRLFDAIGDAAPQALERYTHPDGRQVFTKVKVDEASGHPGVFRSVTRHWN